MMTKTLILSTAGALLMLSSAAQAQSTVSATTDLNIRSGPGSQYKVVGQIDPKDHMYDGPSERRLPERRK